MSKQMKVCANLQQNFTDTEKQTARNNIGAAAFTDVSIWHEMNVDTSKRDSTQMNLIADFGDNGCIGYYFDSQTLLRLTWWHNGFEDYPVFKLWNNNNYDAINGPNWQEPVALGVQFYNGNGHHNTLRWKLSSFKCVDIHFNPFTERLYWKD